MPKVPLGALESSLLIGFLAMERLFFFFNLRHLYLHKGISESRMIIWQGSDVT